MAISKKRNSAEGAPPDEAAFTRLIAEGLADPDDVIDAYEVVLARWVAAGGQFPPAEIVAERPEIDPNEPPTVSALLIRRHRNRMFQEEA